MFENKALNRFKNSRKIDLIENKILFVGGKKTITNCYNFKNYTDIRNFLSNWIFVFNITLIDTENLTQ
jgi:hypothetical protein